MPTGASTQMSGGHLRRETTPTQDVYPTTIVITVEARRPLILRMLKQIDSLELA